MKKLQKDYDSPWKEIVEELFQDFMEFFFPNMAQEIDFSKGYEIKSKDLPKLLKNHEIGKRYADELIRVFLKNGKDTLLFVHIEIQGYEESDFSKRMFIYHYRIFDKYNEEVINLAILTDKNKNYRPNQYLTVRAGFELSMKYPVVKIIDYEDKINILQQSKSPMALVVLAQLRTFELNKQTEDDRYLTKRKLTRLLYNKNFKKKDITNLFKFIDWLISLPPEFEQKIIQEIFTFEEENKVAYVSTIERLAETRGLERGIERGLKEGIEKGIEKGLSKGELKKAEEVARMMLADKTPIEKIMLYTGLNKKSIEDLM